MSHDQIANFREAFTEMTYGPLEFIHAGGLKE
jgi:hypothetical protein